MKTKVSKSLSKVSGMHSNHKQIIVVCFTACLAFLHIAANGETIGQTQIPSYTPTGGYVKEISKMTSSPNQVLLTVEAILDTLVAKQDILLHTNDSGANQTATDDTSSVTSNRLEQEVNIVYDSQKRASVTGAISSVGSEQITQGPVRDIGQLLRGRVPGLSINMPSGNPLDNVEISLRGTKSFSLGSSPLILIDGIPGDLNTIAPQDVETIEVLKDGSAMAIYGSRAANGVLIVTTRRGHRNSPLRVEYQSYIGTESLVGRPDFLTAQDVRRLNEQGVTNYTDYGDSNDLLREITRTPMTMMHDISISGGSNNTWYSGSLNYNLNEGIFLKSVRESTTFLLNLTHAMLDDKITISMGIIAGMENRSNNDFERAYHQAFRNNPTMPLKNDDGSWFYPIPYLTYNPVAMITECSIPERNRNARFYGSINFKPIQNLDMQLFVARSLGSQANGNYITKQHPYSIGTSRTNSYSIATSRDDILEFTTRYSKAIGNHEFRVLGGYSYSSTAMDGLNLSKIKSPINLMGFNQLGAASWQYDENTSVNGWSTPSRTIGFFGRVNYSYSSKYLLQISNRYEGSSTFGESNRWGHFPAVQLGWRVSQESFMSAFSYINDLKVRFGIGVTGLQPSLSQPNLPIYAVSANAFINGEWIPTLVPANSPNPNLKWEQSVEKNIGVDFSLLNQRLSGSIDFYKQSNSDLVYEHFTKSPPAFTNRILANGLEIENVGLEILVDCAVTQSNSISWNTMVAYSTNANKVVSLYSSQLQTSLDYIDAGYFFEPVGVHSQRIQVGKAIGSFWGYKSVGVNEQGDWLIEKPDGEVVEIFDANYNDKQYIGNGVPKHTLSWINTLRYRAFDLSVSLRGAFGFQLINNYRMYYENSTRAPYYNVLSSAFDPIDGVTLSSPLAFVSHYLENGDYLKLDNLTLGYTYKAQNRYVQHVRLYASASNLFTITGYKGVDPEVSIIGMAPGFDELEKYPTTHTFALGLNVSF